MSFSSVFKTCISDSGPLWFLHHPASSSWQQCTKAKHRIFVPCSVLCMETPPIIRNPYPCSCSWNISTRSPLLYKKRCALISLKLHLPAEPTRLIWTTCRRTENLHCWLFTLGWSTTDTYDWSHYCGKNGTAMYLEASTFNFQVFKKKRVDRNLNVFFVSIRYMYQRQSHASVNLFEWLASWSYEEIISLRIR